MKTFVYLNGVPGLSAEAKLDSQHVAIINLAVKQPTVKKTSCDSDTNCLRDALKKKKNSSGHITFFNPPL